MWSYAELQTKNEIIETENFSTTANRSYTRHQIKVQNPIPHRNTMNFKK